ncbi:MULTISPECIES: sensor histidine kinase [unclassified Mesorhizobium]|uniref:sensor histidine kinase n=1 Tax=unclassified Mesorhizobium TaxID=325217 RepID=UPI00112A2DB1|nr:MULTISPECIES: HAMP domain-containing sensor histidine kinase [unclassified Mesorhizobium]MBZ9739939.1 HAMP domain-containing histidine kinase [Mesorhizobium sp. CO1-1-4]MBZ9805752.1 HAMP domain-containing histidine kinase [Mesorhizobium sp. ES1-6]TPL88561.1 HAMP domain-containing histidine kinase [Mesorhizobium sp. B2-3-12]
MRLSERLFGSIGFRLSLQLSLLFVLFAAACALLIGYQLSNIDETARSLRLQRQAGEISQAFRLGDGTSPAVHLPADRMAPYQGDAPTFLYALRDGAGNIIMTSSAAMQNRLGLQFIRQLPFGETDTEGRDGLNNAFYFLVRPLSAKGENLVLIVGQHSSPIDALLRDVEWRLLTGTLLAAIPICLIVFGASLAIVRSGFAPVRRLSQATDRIGPGDPEARIAEAYLPVELRGLAEAANAAAGRLQQAITSQRRFTADTAHQLLTPLALLSARIEQSAVPHPDPGLRGDIMRMQNLVRQLLNLSRLAAVPLPQEKVDLRTVAKDVVAAMAPLAIAEGKSLSYEASEAPCLTTGDASAIGEALANVIRNGLRHTALGTCVEIAVELPAVIAVADKGDGIAEAYRQRLLEPFFTTEADKGGSGLGLAIVDEIMRQHGGAVEVENRLEGGALFRLRFKTA